MLLVCGTGKQSEALCKVQSLFFLQEGFIFTRSSDHPIWGISSLNHSGWRPFRKARGDLGIAGIPGEPTCHKK
jgi:hypothetical protein